MPLQKARSPVPVITTADRRVGLDLQHGRSDGMDQRRVQGVAHLGAIETQHQHATVTLLDELVVGHNRQSVISARSTAPCIRWTTTGRRPAASRRRA
jgi:hypothetical protein